MLPEPHARRRRRGPLAWLAAAPALLVLAAAPASATPPEPASGSTPSASPTERPGLDRLLRLPGHLDYRVDERGGATRGEWRARFEEARAAVERARTALDRAQRALEEEAGGTDAWRMAPPGADASQGPVSYRLRQEVRRQRDELRRAERRLRELEVEANLANVPPEWRGETPAPAANDLPAGPAAPREDADGPAAAAPGRAPAPR